MDEKMIAVCRPHWSCFMGRWIFAFFFAITGLSGLTQGTAEDIAPAIIFFVIAGLFVWSALIMMKSTYIGITETKIVGHKGLIKTKTLSTPLTKVQHVGIESGLFGKLLGYATITISDAGNAGTEFVFKRMADAESFVRIVQNAI